MNKVTIETTEVFPKHVFRADLPVFDSTNTLLELKKETWNIPATSNQAVSTQNPNILNKPIFKYLKTQIIKIAEQVCQEFYFHDVNELDITNSWGVKVSQGSSVFPHKHSNSYLVGTLYLEDKGEPTTFFDFDYNQTFSIFPPTIKNSTSPIYDRFNFPSKAGSIILFPSSLTHGVLIHKGLEPRYSIAFHVNPIGLIGQGFKGKTSILNINKTPEDYKE